MGVSHLEKIEKLLKQGKKLTFEELRDRKNTNINVNTLSECLNYLIKSGKVKKDSEGYLWQSANMSGKEENALRSTACSLGSKDTTKLRTKKAKSTE
jgi:DNA-binding HxlR family transcriptional regulator